MGWGGKGKAAASWTPVWQSTFMKTGKGQELTEACGEASACTETAEHSAVEASPKLCPGKGKGKLNPLKVDPSLKATQLAQASIGVIVG